MAIFNSKLLVITRPGSWMPHPEMLPAMLVRTGGRGASLSSRRGFERATMVMVKHHEMGKNHWTHILSYLIISYQI